VGVVSVFHTLFHQLKLCPIFLTGRGRVLLLHLIQILPYNLLYVSSWGLASKLNHLTFSAHVETLISS